MANARCRTNTFLPHQPKRIPFLRHVYPKRMCTGKILTVVHISPKVFPPSPNKKQNRLPQNVCLLTKRQINRDMCYPIRGNAIKPSDPWAHSTLSVRASLRVATSGKLRRLILSDSRLISSRWPWKTIPFSDLSQSARNPLRLKFDSNVTDSLVNLF